MKAIGREAETKVTAETWEELWKLDGHAMKKAEVPVKDRRCTITTMLAEKWLDAPLFCLDTLCGVSRSSDKGMHPKSLLTRLNPGRRFVGA